jgi:mevalonate pyrophosphate decarboxylase
VRVAKLARVAKQNNMSARMNTLKKEIDFTQRASKKRQSPYPESGGPGRTQAAAAASAAAGAKLIDTARDHRNEGAKRSAVAAILRIITLRSHRK